MYRPESKKGLYLVIIIAFASIIGWVFLYFYKPALIEASCSDVAAGSSRLFANKKNGLDRNYDYNYIKARCLEDAEYAASNK